jgi:prepilin-type processing-associated H-X9-DG protein
MLLPALAAAKRRAQQIKCLSNLKQFGISDVMYASDYGGIMMQPETGLPYGGKAEWVGCLLNYYSKATNLMTCPTANIGLTQAQCTTLGVQWFGIGAGGNAGTADRCYTISLTAAYANSPVGQNINCSYIYNTWFYVNMPGNAAVQNDDDQWKVENAYGYGAANANNPDPAGWIYGKDTAVRNPSQAPLFADGNWVDTTPGEKDTPAANLYVGANPVKNGQTEMGRMTLQRHSFIASSAEQSHTASWQTSPPAGAVNVALADGHAELCKLPNLYNYYWHNNWQPPGIPGTPQ